MEMDVLIYASCPRGQQDKTKKFKKQEKTSWQNELDVISLKSCVMNGESLEHNSHRKEIWKNLKKVLDKFETMC